jgi:hypothetical protein
MTSNGNLKLNFLTYLQRNKHGTLSTLHLDEAWCFVCRTTCCSGSTSVFAIICLSHHCDHPEEGWLALCKKWFVASATLVVIAAAIPTQNQVAVLVGTHYALELGKSPEGQKIVSLVRAKANNYLDEQLKELVEENKPEKEKK